MQLADAIRKAKRVYICGNGGSAANAIHIANDLIACGIKAHALTADVATLTAIANDYGFEHIFSRQLAVMGEPGDLLLALSGSGRSANIIQALEEADRLGMDTWALFGSYGGQALLAAENTINIGATMQQAEEAQIMAGHEVMRCLKSS